MESHRLHASAIIALVLVVLLVVLALVLALRRFSRAALVTGGGAPAPFPYWYKTLPPPGEMFEALEQATTEVKAGGNPVLVRTYPGDYRRSDALSNHYTEGERIECRAGQTPTPREAWESIPASEKKGKSPEELRELIYSKTRECNTFNPAFAKWVLEKTVGRGAKVLDPSSGWGDRLIGALAAGAKSYDGFDPNPSLQVGYIRIVDDLGDGNHDAYHVTEAPFEDAEVEPGAYDIAFTSPPYFSYEEYVPPGAPGEEAQSIGRYPAYEDWVAKMYRPYLENAYRGVRPGGWIVLYIEDTRVGGVRYPLQKLTRDVMAGLGAEPAGRFGLQVVNNFVNTSVVNTKSGGGRARRRRGPTIRWAYAWRVPAT